jgi:hypothetical protein
VVKGKGIMLRQHNLGIFMGQVNPHGWRVGDWKGAEARHITKSLCSLLLCTFSLLSIPFCAKVKKEQSPSPVFAEMLSRPVAQVDRLRKQIVSKKVWLRFGKSNR